MSFIAKPNGGYSISSTEGINNIYEIYNYLNPLGYNKECVIGMIGNMVAESGLNPWRWQDDSYNLSNGYGLVQFTPASGYINLSDIPDHAPNLSTTEQTSGSSPNDGKGQLYVFNNDSLGKWDDSCWRLYWDPNDYPNLYNLHSAILNTYGNGSSLTINQFKNINDYTYSTFAFLACYEGPAIPNYSDRLTYAAAVKTILDPYIPGSRFDILVLKKIINRNFKRI